MLSHSLSLARLTRKSEPDAPQFIKDYVLWGAGPRASQYLVLGAKARAVLMGRFFATQEDVRAVAAHGLEVVHLDLGGRGPDCHVGPWVCVGSVWALQYSAGARRHQRQDRQRGAYRSFDDPIALQRPDQVDAGHG